MNFKSYSLLVIIWIISLFIAFGLAYNLGFFTSIPTNENLLRWDAIWYKSIFTKGYLYKESGPSNPAFFPFLPLVWKAIGGGAIKIGAVNLLIFLTGLWFLVKNFKTSFYETLVLVSLPSMLFFYLPYTEALFFLFGTFIIIGIKKNNNYILVPAIFLASFARPSFLFFIPAFAVLFLVDYEEEKKWYLVRKYVLNYILPSILALVIILIVQKIQTDTWFAFFKAQRNGWSAGFRFPRLPFGSLEDKSLYWVEVMSFWLGSLVTGVAIFIGYHFYKTKTTLQQYDKTFLFSISFLVMAFVSIVFFHPTWVIGRTLLHGINRYMFANPFFFIFIWQSSKYFNAKKIHFIYLFLGSLLLWLLVEPFFSYLEYLPYYLAITAYLVLFSFALQRKNKAAYLFLFVVNIIGQIYLLNKFINAEWIG